MEEWIPSVVPMACATSSADESLAYGYAKGMKKAFDDFFASRDPKGQKRKRKNSSAVRGQLGAIRSADDILLLGELQRRLAFKKKRELARIRKRRQREKMSRSKA